MYSFIWKLRYEFLLFESFENLLKWLDVVGFLEIKLIFKVDFKGDSVLKCIVLYWIYNCCILVYCDCFVDVLRVFVVSFRMGLNFRELVEYESGEEYKVYFCSWFKCM